MNALTCADAMMGLAPGRGRTADLCTQNREIGPVRECVSKVAIILTTLTQPSAGPDSEPGELLKAPLPPLCRAWALNLGTFITNFTGRGQPGFRWRRWFMDGDGILVEPSVEKASGWAPEYDDDGGWYDPDERAIVQRGMVEDRRN